MHCCNWQQHKSSPCPAKVSQMVAGMEQDREEVEQSLGGRETRLRLVALMCANLLTPSVSISAVIIYFSLMPAKQQMQI